MNFQRLKHALVRLSPEEKVVGIGGLAVILAAFMPWYSVVFSYNKEPVIHSGFSGDLGVIGFVVFILTLLSLLLLLGESMHIRIPTFGQTKEKLMLFLLSEGAFLVLITIAIYTRRSFDYTNAELRFGIYLALIGACLSTFAAFAEVQKESKKEVEAFFDHSDEEKVDKKSKEVAKEDDEKEKQEEEEEAVVEEVEEITETENINEDDIVEGVSIKEKVEPGQQSNYFMREAGINEEEAAKEEKKKKEDDGPESLSMNFYEDES